MFVVIWLFWLKNNILADLKVIYIKLTSNDNKNIFSKLKVSFAVSLFDQLII